MEFEFWGIGEYSGTMNMVGRTKTRLQKKMRLKKVQAKNCKDHLRHAKVIVSTFSQ